MKQYHEEAHEQQILEIYSFGSFKVPQITGLLYNYFKSFDDKKQK